MALFALYGLGAAASLALLAKLKTRLELSKAKHRSLTGHARMARRVASLVPFYEYDEEQFFRSDAAPDDDCRAPPRRLRAPDRNSTANAFRRRSS